MAGLQIRPNPEFGVANLRELHVLGTPLLVTDYSGLSAQCLEWSRNSRCVAPDFGELTSAYDHFPPDGMPLIWCLNRAGANLRDRVYGPTFMRQFLSNVSG